MSDPRILINAWLDGAITRRDAEQLNGWMQRDRAHIRAFAEQVMLHQSLKKLSEAESARMHGNGVAPGVPGRKGDESSRLDGGLWSGHTWIIAVTALMLLSVAPPFWLLLRDGRSPEDVSVAATKRVRNDSDATSTTVLSPRLAGEPPAARFSRSVNVAWAAAAHRWSVGDVMRAGDTIRLDDGRVELVFDSGAVMTLVGPAALDIHSPLLATLHSGTATTRVENIERGEFKIFTPSTEVTDLGTEFGVRVGPGGGETDVVVFDGAVDLGPVDGRTSQTAEGFSSRRLSVGEAVRVRANGGCERLVSIDSSAFPFGDRMFHVSHTRPPLIIGVRDDLRSPDSSKFYRIYHEGLAEDARAYVDRVHEWNGVAEEGIPHFLRGADYIATFNDDSKRTSREVPSAITVELSGPAMLYVLYHDQFAVPEWLSASFEDTGTKVGVDEGPSPNAQLEVGSGSGKSIDGVCSIWRRRVNQPGPIVLGRVGPARPDPRPRRTMYGIAAQPL